MTHLQQKRCLPCEGGITALDSQQQTELLKDVKGWTLNDNGKALVRLFKFDDYYQTMAFVNAIAFISHQEGHHPDLEVHYNSCKVRYTTHAIDGLSENDFICAAKVNALT